MTPCKQQGQWINVCQLAPCDKVISRMYTLKGGSAIKNQRRKQHDLFVSAFNNVLYLLKATWLCECGPWCCDSSDHEQIIDVSINNVWLFDHSKSFSNLDIFSAHHFTCGFDLFSQFLNFCLWIIYHVYALLSYNLKS